MNKIFIRYMAGFMAFMILFASVTFASGANMLQPSYGKTEFKDGLYEYSGFTIKPEDCEKIVSKSGKVTYKYIFKVPEDATYEIRTQNTHQGEMAAIWSHTEDDKELYGGLYNIYLNDGSENAIAGSISQGGIIDPGLGIRTPDRFESKHRVLCLF